MPELGSPSSPRAFFIKGLMSSQTSLFWYDSRALDAVFNFLLVWYFCTLTIRESILITNGSRSATGPLMWSLISMRNSCVGDQEVDAVFTRVLSGSKVGGSSITTSPPSCLASCSPGQFTSVPSKSVKVPRSWRRACPRFCSNRPDGVLYQMFRNQFISYCLYQSKEPLLLWNLFPASRYRKCFSVCRFCSVPPVLLPERLFVPTANAGRTAHHGPDSRSEEPDASASTETHFCFVAILLFLWILKDSWCRDSVSRRAFTAVTQCVLLLQRVSSPGCGEGWLSSFLSCSLVMWVKWI